MGFLNSPEFWGALAVAGLGYVILLIRTAINQQQTLAIERMRDSVIGEVGNILRSYDERLKALAREVKELRELRRKDNLALAKLLTSCPCGPDATEVYGFDKHPYKEEGENVN